MTITRFWRSLYGPPLNLCSLGMRVFVVDQQAERRVERGLGGSLPGNCDEI